MTPDPATSGPAGATATPPGGPPVPPTGRARFGWPVYAWGLWDWGSAAFNAVITTFVFSVYITSDDFGPNADTNLGWALAGAGLLVAVFAPITGQRADRSGRRGFWLGVNTMLVVAVSAALFLVQPSEDYLWLGLVLLASGNIFFEFASVNYNAMLNEISTPTHGRARLGAGLGPGLHRRHRAAAGRLLRPDQPRASGSSGSPARTAWTCG